MKQKCTQETLELFLNILPLKMEKACKSCLKVYAKNWKRRILIMNCIVKKPPLDPENLAIKKNVVDLIIKLIIILKEFYHRKSF